MKEKKVLKAIMIMFVAYIILTWFIPTGLYSSGEFVSSAVTPVGFFDMFMYPIVNFTTSQTILIGLIVLLIGALYGVLNKTGAYQKFVDNTVKRFKGKETLFLIITTINFFVLADMTSLNYPILILVPFFATVLLLLGHSRMTTLISTIGAVLFGNIVSLYGYDIAGITKYFTGGLHEAFLFKLALLVAVFTTLIITVVFSSKKKEKVENIPLYEKKTSKKSSAPMLIIVGIMMLLLFIGMTAWEDLFGIKLFSDIYKAVTGIKVAGLGVFDYLLGASVFAMGTWNIYHVMAVIVLMTCIIGLVYKIKFADFIDACASGMKQVLVVAIYAVLANIILVCVQANQQGYSIFPYIANQILSLTKDFNVWLFSLVSGIGSIFYNDYYYYANAMYDLGMVVYKDSSQIAGFALQFMHGFVQLIAPTSVMLVVGLKYFDLSYKDWFKKMWLPIILILIFIIVVLTIMALI